MAKLWELLKLLPTLFGLIAQLKKLWQEHLQKKHTESVKKQEQAQEKLEKAKTAEEVWKANEDITRNLP